MIVLIDIGKPFNVVCCSFQLQLLNLFLSLSSENTKSIYICEYMYHIILKECVSSFM